MLTTQNEAIAAMFSGQNCLLSGVAGTGKSHTVREFIKKVNGVTVTASTGIAALNVQGMTLHRFCGMGLGPRPDQSFEEFLIGLERKGGFGWSKAVWRMINCKRLVVDEVSMLPGRTLDFVDYLMRKVRQDQRPFGGVQVIAVGDFLQLAPVRKDPTVDYDWAFTSKAWQQADFRNIYLQKIYRQDEPDLIDTLNKIRIGDMSGDTERILKRRVIDFPSEEIPRLMTHNSQVDKWNREMLSKLPGQDRVFTATESGNEYEIEFLRKNLVTPRELVLRTGANVMITANNSEKGYVNGMLGKVVFIEDEKITVETKELGTIEVTQNLWQYDWQNDDSACFMQFPLRLAYGMTIHKAQGLTLESALIDIRAAREPGQAYVALSRVKSLRGLFLTDWFKCFYFSRQAKKFYDELK